jgi:hypothetical protein
MLIIFIFLTTQMLMLKLYKCTIREKQKRDAEFIPFTNEFLKPMMRMLLMTGDEKVFQPLVLTTSNKMFSYLVQDAIYGPLFLVYIDRPENNLSSAVFVSVFPRLLLYECQADIRCALPYVYEILWELVRYNNHKNAIQEMIASRNQEPKLANLLDLLMLHIARSDEEGDAYHNESDEEELIPDSPTTPLPKKEVKTRNTLGLLSLQFLVNMCLHNTAFRELVVKSPKSVPICKVIMQKVSQKLNREDDLIILGKTILACKLTYVLFMQVTFQIRVLRDIFIEKQEKDFFELTFSSITRKGPSSPVSNGYDDVVEVSEQEIAVNENRIYSFCTWLHVILANNIVKQYNDLSILSFVESSITTACLRMLRVVIDSYPDIIIRDLRNVKNFYDSFLSTLLSVLRASVDECLAGDNKSEEEGHRRFLMLRENAAIIVHVFSFLMEQRLPVETTRQELAKLHKVLMDQGEVIIQRTLTTFQQTIEKVDNKEFDTNNLLIDNLTQLLKYTQFLKQKK